MQPLRHAQHGVFQHLLQRARDIEVALQQRRAALARGAEQRVAVGRRDR